MSGETWDVVIIGGAVTGASTAWWLLQADPALRVAVIEKDPSYARAATALSVASVRQQFSNPVNVEISRFGVGFIRDFGARVGEAGGVPSLGLKENGYLFLSGTAEGAALLNALAAMQRGLGAATEVLGPEALSQRFPWMQVDDVTAGSIGARDEGWFDNMGLLNGFRNAARAKGAVFVQDRVTGLERSGDRIVAALTENGLTLFLVDPKTAGVEIERTVMVDAHNAARVTLTDVEVDADAVIGSVDGGEALLEGALNLGRACAAASLNGAGDQAFQTTMEYLRTRKQFGKLIGEFQALQHRAAHLYSEVEIARAVTMKAAQLLDGGSEKADLMASVAKAKVAKAAGLAVREGVQMHGGIGMTDEYDIGLYMKRDRALQEFLGDQYYHASRVADMSGY